jgi:hypothetical protein
VGSSATSRSVRRRVRSCPNDEVEPAEARQRYGAAELRRGVARARTDTESVLVIAEPETHVASGPTPVHHLEKRRGLLVDRSPLRRALGLGIES